MNKTELVNKIAEKSGLSKKDSEKALTAAVDSITEALCQGDKRTACPAPRLAIVYPKKCVL